MNRCVVLDSKAIAASADGKCCRLLSRAFCRHKHGLA